MDEAGGIVHSQGCLANPDLECFLKVPFEETDMAIFISDSRGRCLDLNPRALSLTGHCRQELIGKDLLDLYQADDQGPSIYRGYLQQGKTLVAKGRLLRKDGGWLPVELRILKLSDGHFLETAFDITEQKAAEQERKNLQTQLAVAMEMAHLGHWEYDVKNDTFTFNDQFYRIFRTSVEKVGGYTMSAGEYAYRFIHPDDRHIVEQEVRLASEATDPGFSRKIEHRIVYDDGTTGYISVHYFIEKDETGRIVKTYGINQDITDRKLAEEERRNLEHQVRQAQKMESIGLMAGGVAHDFNNLLTPILGYSDILSHDLAEGDERLEKLSHIRKAAIRAKEVAQQLLAFSRKRLLELRAVDLGDIIRKFRNMLRRTIRENIEINIKIAPDLWLVKADPGQIEQVLLNMSINAQDAMPEGGRLVIEADNINIDQSYASRHRDIQAGPYVVLSVSDTGIGMDQAAIKQIFEPFYTTKELGRGTGFGLSTAYGIIKQQNGSIVVSSGKDQGSTFNIFFPKADPKEDQKIEESLHLPGHIPKGCETVLVVEDDDMVRSLACDMLIVLGYKVLAAEDPECCLDLVHKHSGDIHLLLADIIMPKMNGKELYARLNRLHPDLKVIFMTGYASNIIGNENIIHHDTNFIKKPFSLHELSEVIRQTLDSE